MDISLLSSLLLLLLLLLLCLQRWERRAPLS
jgi:hypothetical protein